MNYSFCLNECKLKKLKNLYDKEEYTKQIRNLK